jgi:hypothetical protein
VNPWWLGAERGKWPPSSAALSGCSGLGWSGWDRTSDLPRVKLRRNQKPDVHAGQAGRTGPILGVQNTRYERRGGCGADEIEAVIGRHERPA